MTAKAVQFLYQLNAGDPAYLTMTIVHRYGVARSPVAEKGAAARPLALVLCLILVAGCSAWRAPVAKIHDARLLMGTQVAIAAETEEVSAARAGVDAAFAAMQRLSDEMNHYDPASLVSAINRAAGVAPVAVTPALMAVLQQAQALSVRTDGAFDITIGALTGWRFDRDAPQAPNPADVRAGLAKVGYRDLVLDATRGTAFLRRPGMRIDLGGIAKLYIVDVGLQVLRGHGLSRAQIDAGGDIGVFGGTHTRPWRIGIRDPRAQGLAAVVELMDGFVVSSGDYERFFLKDGRRYHHIIDPRTGYPTAGLQQVTLVARNAAAVNGLSAATMVLGESAGRALIEATPGVSGYLVGDTRRWHSADFPFAPN